MHVDLYCVHEQCGMCYSFLFTVITHFNGFLHILSCKNIVKNSGGDLTFGLKKLLNS